MTEANLRKKGLDPGFKQMEDDEFSVMTEDPDLLPTENILDVKLAKIQLQPNQINEILGMKDPLESAVQTFITLEFFNHET